jgi:hypothetical protein
MSELFDIPQSKSPRLKWQDYHGITCVETDLDLPDNRWQAMHPDMQTKTRGATAEDALFLLVQKLNEIGVVIKLWNEE